MFSYISEFLPVKKRGAFLNLVAAFWMVGTILAAGLAWALIGARVRRVLLGARLFPFPACPPCLPAHAAADAAPASRHT